VTLVGEMLVWAFQANAVADESPRYLFGTEGRISVLAFAEDAVAATVNDGRELHLWELISPLALHLRHGGVVKSLAATADGSLLVTGSIDRTARVWSTRTGELRAYLSGSSAVASVAVPDHGEWFAAAGSDQVVEISDLRGTKRQIYKHLSHIRALSLSSNGLIATASADGTSVVLDALGGVKHRIVHSTEKAGDDASRDRLEDEVTAVAWSRDGKLATTGNNGRVRIWNGRELERDLDHGAPVHSLAWSPDGELLLSTGANGAVKLWSRGGSVRTLQGHLGAVFVGRFDPMGRWIVTASEDGTARVWSARGGQLLQTIRAHGRPVRDAVFAPGQCPKLATVGDDGNLRLWSTRSWREQAIFAAHGEAAEHVVFLGGGGQVASGGADGYVRVYPTCTRPVLDALCEMRDRDNDGKSAGPCPAVKSEECCP
jgi:WD40 repeat protein